MNLSINRDFERNRAEIYLVENAGGVNRYFSYSKTKGFTSVDVPIGSIPTNKIEPLLIVPMPLLPDIFKLFGDEANNAGLSTSNEDLLKGKLAASEKHLEDMRVIARHLLKIK